MKKIRVSFFVFLSLLSLLYMPCSAQQTTGNNNHAVTDAITIEGKFITPCNIPPSVKISAYNILMSPFQDVQVNANGTFTYQLIIKDPKQVALRTNNSIFEFIVTPEEKIYHIEIVCGADQAEKISVINSNENKAFLPFNELTKTFKTELAKIADTNLDDKNTFSNLANLISNYQNKTKAIAKTSRGTFTGDVLCPATQIPPSALISISALRANFFQPQFFKNQHFYYNFLPASIIINYFNLLNNTDTSFAWVEKIMDTAIQNHEAGRLFQQTIYSLFYNMHKEALLIKYIGWADNNPDSMFDFLAKMKLSEAKKTMPGAPEPDFQLEDTTGALNRISETIASSKLTLLIFYSPTCEHCQEQLPKLLPLWDKYKNSGLKIYAVGCEAEKNEWRNFIHNKSTAEWTNVFEPYSDKAPSVLYFGIHDYPKYILINQKGTIVSRFNNLQIILNEIPKQMAN